MLLHYLLSPISGTCHHFLITNCIYRWLDQANRVEASIIYKLLEKHFLVLQLYQSKVTFNTIEVRTIRNVIDWSDLKSFKCLLWLLTFVDLQVVHENCKRFSIELFRELFQKLDEELCVNWLQVCKESFKANILTYSCNYSLSFSSDLGFIDRYAGIWWRPCFTFECVKCENSFIKIY